MLAVIAGRLILGQRAGMPRLLIKNKTKERHEDLKCFPSDANANRVAQVLSTAPSIQSTTSLFYNLGVLTNMVRFGTRSSQNYK